MTHEPLVQPDPISSAKEIVRRVGYAASSSEAHRLLLEVWNLMKQSLPESRTKTEVLGILWEGAERSRKEAVIEKTRHRTKEGGNLVQAR